MVSIYAFLQRRGRTTRNPIAARTTRKRITTRPLPRPECEIITVDFEVDDKVVSLIDLQGTRIPLFPSGRINGPGSVFTLDESLRQTIITIMQDL